MAGFVIFFHSCTSLFLSRVPDGYRPAQTPVSTLSSGSDEADNTGSAHCFAVCSQAWQDGWSWGCGGYSRMARQFAICYEKQTRNIQSVVCRRQNGTSRAPARHKAGQRHRSQMLSPSLLWHANSISIIKVRSLFALSGLSHGQRPYLLVVDKQVWVEYEAYGVYHCQTTGKTFIYEKGN